MFLSYFLTVLFIIDQHYVFIKKKVQETLISLYLCFVTSLERIFMLACRFQGTYFSILFISWLTIWTLKICLTYQVTVTELEVPDTFATLIPNSLVVWSALNFHTHNMVLNEALLYRDVSLCIWIDTANCILATENSYNSKTNQVQSVIKNSWACTSMPRFGYLHRGVDIH